MLGAELRQKLIAVGERLISQEEARVLVWPRERAEGFWFGAGNICREPGGDLLLSGRYRNGGDSRSGLKAGPRGAELAILLSSDGGRTFRQVASFYKRDLSLPGAEVLSIEGSCLYDAGGQVELFVSSEKELPYPSEVRGFQKPGTGTWSIDVLRRSGSGLFDAKGLSPAFSSQRPEWLHVKDPVVCNLNGSTVMLYCTHPFTWASSNSGCAVRNGAGGAFVNVNSCILPRGPAWDVAACRITARLPLPKVGILRDKPLLSLYFYDGAECMHPHGAARAADGLPKGYSCEEVGGLAAGFDDEFPKVERLSEKRPLFASPWGTGCSRYVSVFDAGDCYLATWQQSQEDRCQPLVINRVPKKAIEAILSE